MIDFEPFEAMTFDCYGTLIDWESGILAALGELLGPSVAASDAELLDAYARFEPEAEAGPFRPYRDVLMEVAGRFGSTYGLDVDRAMAERFASSVPTWPPFPDTVGALRDLAERFRLAIVSNVDDDLFEGTARLLGNPFSEVVTAQQVRSYKPGRAHFDEALRRLELPRERVLHVAQSLHHDIVPGKELGFSCVWVNRQGGRTGATPAAVAEPDLEVPDLATLVRTIGL